MERGWIHEDSSTKVVWSTEVWLDWQQCMSGTCSDENIWAFSVLIFCSVSSHDRRRESKTCKRLAYYGSQEACHSPWNVQNIIAFHFSCLFDFIILSWQYQSCTGLTLPSYLWPAFRSWDTHWQNCLDLSHHDIQGFNWNAISTD